MKQSEFSKKVINPILKKKYGVGGVGGRGGGGTHATDQ